MEPLHLGAQEHHHQYEGASNGVDFEGDLKPKNGFGEFGGLAYKLKRRFEPKQAKLNTWTFVAQVPHKVMVARFQFKYHVAPLLLLGCLHVLHLLVLYMVGCLCHESNS